MSGRRVPATMVVWIASLAWSPMLARAQPRETETYHFDARMSGSGSAIGRLPVRYSFRLWCEPDGRPNDLALQWGSRHHFELTSVEEAVCRETSDGRSVAGAANFDVHGGAGLGSLDGRAGARIVWSFVDSGEGRGADRAELTVTDADGGEVLNAAGYVEKGRQRAFGAAIPVAPPGVDADGRVHSLVIDRSGRMRRLTITTLPASAIGQEPAGDPKPEPPREPSPPKVDPELQAELARGEPDDRVVVVVSLRGDLAVPRFPDLPRGVSRDSPEAEPILAAGAAIARDLGERRGRAVDDFLRIVSAGGVDVRVLDHFWLISAFVADVRLGDVPALAAPPQVVYVQPSRLTVPVRPPHHDGPPDFPPHVGAFFGGDVMGTVKYANLSGMKSGSIGLIDTGVSPHNLLTNVGKKGDCVFGGPTCLVSSKGFETNDCHDTGHGMSAAAILTGNSSLGPETIGVTDVTVDSWKVWSYGLFGVGCSVSTEETLSPPAVVRAFQAGLLAGNRVFVANFAAPAGNENDVMAAAANGAFDAGAVVVAPNGNCAVDPNCNVRMGPPPPKFQTVGTPALASKVLGVGDFNVVDLKTRDYQSRGPAPGQRIKPDLQAPTDVTTAGREDPFFDFGDPSALRLRFGGTSAAAPFAGGAAQLMQNWLKKANTFDAGSSYARLILSGDKVAQQFGIYSNVSGVGHLRMPNLCGVTANWDKVIFSGPYRLGEQPVVSIPLKVASANSLAAALWWPEEGAHNDIDLELVDPFGNVKATADSTPSVFERTEVLGPTPGTWTLRIIGFKFQSLPQTVYWSADVRGPCGPLAP